MLLNMYIDDVLIESIPIKFDGLKTVEQRQRYLENLSAKLLHRHLGKIIHTRFWPEFFVEGVASKINDEETDEGQS